MYTDLLVANFMPLSFVYCQLFKQRLYNRAVGRIGSLEGYNCFRALGTNWVCQLEIIETTTGNI